jgi:biopolymer transport protein ExbD
MSGDLCFRLIASFFGALLLANSCLAANSQTNDANDSDVVAIDLPVCHSQDAWPCGGDSKLEFVEVDHHGDLILNHSPASWAMVDQAMRKASQASPTHEVQLVPSPNAPYRASVDVLKLVRKNEVNKFGFVGNSKHQLIRTAKSPVDYWPSDLKLLQNDPLARLLQIFVTTTDASGREPSDALYSGVTGNGQCRAYLNGRPMSSEALSNQMTAHMVRVLESLGGEQAIASGRIERKNVPRATIIGSGDVPWRCVGGAIWAAQVSGFLTVGFRVLEM